MRARNAGLSDSAKFTAELVQLPDDALLTVEDLVLLGAGTKATLATWRCRGLGPVFTHVGNAARYRAGDVRAWIAAGGSRGTLHRRDQEAA